MWGTQFQPDKAFSRYTSESYPDSSTSVALNRFLADVFVFHAKKSNQKFGWYNQEIHNLVQNYDSFESGTEFGRLYKFKTSDGYN